MVLLALRDDEGGPVNATVVPFPIERTRPPAEEPWRSKKWIASHYGFSVRWVELRIAEGAPSELIRGRRRLKLSAFADWLDNRP